MASVSTTSFGDQAFVIATSNPGKRREFAVLLTDFLSSHWKIYDRCGFPTPLEPIEETGQTFIDNARQKAVGTADQTGCCALADDSGLVVDALDGAPGVKSARIAGENATDEENNRRLVQCLRGVDASDRRARFVCVLCLALPDNQVAREILERLALDRSSMALSSGTDEGQWQRIDDQVVIWFRATVEGMIAEEPAGDQGFGYDPYFRVPELGKRMAQLSVQEKNQLSHRARATRKMLAYFQP